MTLEEIQAIVAAGEDSDGLVTFANDNQPTIAFNFSQPPHTKVHSVVTNVQNVLKGQMEAHRNKPVVQPTLDTPDVSESWSLILPSIFGNTGVDIVPDKPTSSYIPETDTLDDQNSENEDNSLSKEGDTHILNSTAVDTQNNIQSENLSTVEDKVVTLVSTTDKPTTKITTTKISSTSHAPSSSTATTRKPVTTRRPATTTVKLVPTTISSKPTTTFSTTAKPTTSKPFVRITPKTTTSKPTTTTTRRQITTSTTAKDSIVENLAITEKPVEFEKISTFIPVSTVQYVTKQTTRKPVGVTDVPIVYASTTKRSPSSTTKAPHRLSTTQLPKTSTTTTVKPIDEVVISSTPKTADRVNVTTVTTQSVSPSTAVSSTELISPANSHTGLTDNNMKDNAALPLFDVALSISQIASDLGSNYQPLPTTNDLLDTTQVNSNDMESKENIDLDITEENANLTDKNVDNFVKISTIEPHPENKGKENETTSITEVRVTTEITTTETVDITTISPSLSYETTIDPILSESMGDLLSQVVNEAPQSMPDEISNQDNKSATTEQNIETTTDVPLEITTEIMTTTVKEVPSTTKKPLPAIENKTEKLSTTQKVSITEKIPTIEKLSPAENILTTKKVLTIENVSTTEKILTAEKIAVEKVTKITASNKNTLDSKEKHSGTSNENKDFVKISVSTHKDASKVESVTNKEEAMKEKDNKNKTDVNFDKKTENQTITDPFEEAHITKLPSKSEVSTTSAKPDVTTKPAVSVAAQNKTIAQSLMNKINSVNKFTNKNEKVSDSGPKVDEFKKKIQKVNIADEELSNERNNSWKLVPTLSPPKINEIPKDSIKPDNPYNPENVENKDVIFEYSKENQGLEVTTKDLGEDIAQFTELCNELAFRYWHVMVDNIDKRRSFVLSPYSVTSMLAMMFMGARGSTSGEMNEILKLDDMVTFNPHFTLKNISDSIESASESGIVVSTFIRELFSDRNKGKILTFYKERAQHFYNGHVEEINFKLISDIIRRRTNLLVKRYTWGRIPEYMKSNSIVMNPPLAAFSTNIFQVSFFHKLPSFHMTQNTQIGIYQINLGINRIKYKKY